MSSTKENISMWHGISDATDDHHQRVYDRYGGDLARYRFELSDDLSLARITDDAEAANGIWTLAEILATGESWRVIASVASRMRAAIRRNEESKP